MGQKVNPIGFRLGVYRNWDARWYADKEYATLLREDLEMRRLITGRLRNAGLARIETERSANQLTIIIQTAKPGIVIGKQGQQVDALRDELERLTGKKVRVTIHEIKTPELDAKLVAESVASQLEKRIAFRRAMKQGVGRSMRAGAKGVRIQVSGRLGGSEMSRREWDRDGRVPLHTLRANVDYGQAEARTTFGRIGVTVWLYKGDFVTATGEPVLAVDGRAAARADEEDDRGGRRAATTPTLVQPRAEAAAEPTAEPTAEALSAAPDTEVAASEAPAPTGAEAPATDVPAPAETAPEPEAEGTAEVEADLDVEPEIEISPEEKIAAELGVPVEEDASPAQRTTAKRRAPARRATTPAGKGPRPKPPTGKAKPKAGDAVVDPEREEE